MKRVVITALLLFISYFSYGQQIKGYVRDALSKEPLVGVAIFYSDAGVLLGSITDAEGYYEMVIPEGNVVVTYSYIGFETVKRPLLVQKGQDVVLDIAMQMELAVMDEVVISVGRYEQKLSEVTVSMDILKAGDIAIQNPTDLSAVLNTMPGVDVTDKQPSIRGGSGWTWGVGSRSLILVDGMSVLTPSVGEINWNMIPMENIDQVEVIKGASSVLYGSSALNGLINVRTARPGLDPMTKVNLYMGVYGDPKNNDYVWWSRRNPVYAGMDASHSQRVGNLDVTGSMNLFTDEGYRDGNYNKRFRVGGNLTYHDPHVRGLNYGLNGNFLSNENANFFIWRSAKEAYRQSAFANMGRKGDSFYLDPFLNYINEEKNTTHRLKARVYHKADGIKSERTDKSMEEIAEGLHFDYSKTDELTALIENPMNALVPVIKYLPDVMNGYFDGAAHEIEKMANYYFPGAEPPAYVDLLSWIMKGDKNSPRDNTWSYYVDYQFNKKYENAQFTAGGTFDHTRTKSYVTGLHKSDNIGLFVQYDRKLFGRLNASLGMRLEYYRVDSLYREAETKVLGAKIPFKPILRGGLNYELAEHSFLRASVGQGYRYPSIAEKFVFKDIGGVAAYPNADLHAEKGFSAELGIKQGYRVGNFMGYVDVAGFYNYYKDMIEFQFGLFNSQTFSYITNLMDVITMIGNGQMPGFGTRFQNVSKAQIYGVDASVNGVWNIQKDMRMAYNVGYVYTEPRDLNARKVNEAEAANEDILAMKSKSNTSEYLRYRQKHSAKAVVDFYWKRFSVGTNLAWKSKTLAVDYMMVDERDAADGKTHKDLMDYVRGILFYGLHDYWMDTNNGYFTMDMRLGYRLNKYLYLQASVNNLLNTEYSLRPMDVSAPRTFVFKVGATF